MGVTLGPVFDKKFPDDKLFGDYSDGKHLVYGMTRFDEICAAKSVTLFSTLCGPDEDEMEETPAPRKRTTPLRGGVGSKNLPPKAE